MWGSRFGFRHLPFVLGSGLRCSRSVSSVPSVCPKVSLRTSLRASSLCHPQRQFDFSLRSQNYHSISLSSKERSEKSDYQSAQFRSFGLVASLGAALLFGNRFVYAEETPDANHKEEQEKKGSGDGEVGQSAEGDSDANEPDAQSGSEIPHYDYVLVGGGLACYKALQAIRDNDKDGTILCIGGEDEYPYERAALTKGLWFQDQDSVPKEVSEKLSKMFDLGNGDSREMEKDYGVTFHRGVVVLKAWGDDRVLALSNHSLVKYGKLLIATGGSPAVNFEVTDNAVPHVSTFQRLQDFKDLKAIVDQGGKTITVVGGGLTGCELASILSTHRTENKNTIRYVIREENVLERYLPRFLAEYATESLRSKGVSLVTQKEISKIRKDSADQSGSESAVDVAEQELSGTVELVFKDGEIATSDYVVIATGNVPNVDIATALKLELDPIRGGIVTNSQLQAVSGVYVAGDVCSFYDRVLGIRRRVEHGDNASWQGRVAGHNMSLAPPDLTGVLSREEMEKRRKRASPHHFNYQPIYSSFAGDNWFHAVGVVDPQKYKTFSVFDKGQDGKNEGEKKYRKGVVYYLQEVQDEETGATIHHVVGMVLWNLSRIRLAQRTLKSKPKILRKEDLVRLIPLEDPAPIEPFIPGGESEEEEEPPTLAEDEE